jgi:hypothetical protein
MNDGITLTGTVRVRGARESLVCRRVCLRLSLLRKLVQEELHLFEKE